MLIRIDAIGDYVLFRNYIEAVKKSPKYAGYRIDLLGNKRWEEIARKYDGQHVSRFWFIDEHVLYEKPGKVLKLGWKLFNQRYEEVIQPTYSRTLMGNGLAGLAAGRVTVGYMSDKEHHPRYKKKTDKFYSILIQKPVKLIHECEINHFFFEHVLERAFPVIQPRLPIKGKERAGIMLFTGSSTHKKNWEKEKFLEIMHRILNETEHSIILAGDAGEVPIVSYLLGNVQVDRHRVVDKTGRSSLSDFFELVSNSALVLTNDTNTVHVAAACSVPAICILGGGHFGRFLPYPDNFSNNPVPVYASMHCYNCDWLCQYPTPDHKPFPCISRVNIEDVWQALKKHL